MDIVIYRQSLEELIQEALANSDGSHAGIRDYLHAKEKPGRLTRNREEKQNPGGFLTAPGARWPWAVAVLLLLGAGIAWRVRSRTTTVEAAPPTPVETPLTPEERVLGELARLRGESPEGRPAVLRWYDEATTAVRAYLAARYSVPADRMTTPECVRAVPDASAAPLRRFLVHGDAVKFARHRPGAAERDEALDDAEAFVTTGEGRA